MLRLVIVISSVILLISFPFAEGKSSFYFRCTILPWNGFVKVDALISFFIVYDEIVFFSFVLIYLLPQNVGNSISGFLIFE